MSLEIFLNLPLELQSKIFYHLPVVSRFDMMLSCHHFYNLGLVSSSWKDIKEAEYTSRERHKALNFQNTQDILYIDGHNSHGKKYKERSYNIIKIKSKNDKYHRWIELYDYQKLISLILPIIIVGLSQQKF